MLPDLTVRYHWLPGIPYLTLGLPNLTFSMPTWSPDSQIYIALLLETHQSASRASSYRMETIRYVKSTDECNQTTKHCNRNLETSTAPNKRNCENQLTSQALSQYKIDR